MKITATQAADTLADHFTAYATPGQQQALRDLLSATGLLHLASIDTAEDADGTTASKAFCETCPWSGTWHHSTDFSASTMPRSAAYEAAESEASEHATATVRFL